MQPAPANAPKDQVLPIPRQSDAEHADYQALIDRARAGLPAVRRRFRDGLPAGQRLFVTTLLRSPGDRAEQLFVQVVDWNDDRGPRGVIASQVANTPGVRFGDSTMVLESAILDWTVSGPDGSEEGNLLGKYLEQRGGR
jgi:hypothetical protein